MAKLIKIEKTDQLVDFIKKIKALKGDEAVFDIPDKSPIFKTPHNLQLIKKSALALGKTIIIRTDDPAGKSLVAKAGLLLDDGDSEVVEVPKKIKTKKVRFNDLGSQSVTRISPVAVAPVVSEISDGNKGFLPELPKIKTPKIGTTFSRFFVLGIIVLILAVFGAAVILPKAQITVYARSEPIIRDIEISVDKDIRSINSSRLAVPGEVVNKEISHTKNFQTTGVKLTGTKSTGTVQLYNFTKNTLTLRAATTTLIVDGKKYSFTKDVTGLRPTARIGQGGEQEVDQSSLIAPVAIVAQEVGANFNIAADLRMEIQNAALGQADVFAETRGAVTGGNSQEIKVISQQDLDNATKAMQDELPNLTEAEIAAEAEGVKILSNAVKSEILAKTANKNVGDEATVFDMTIIARVTALSYKEADVKALVVEKINSVLSEDKYLLEDGKQDLTATFKTVNVDAGTGVLAVHYETVAAYKVENTNLSKILAGKDAIEIKEILLTKPEIDRVDVSFSPFFVKKAPRFNGKIYISTVQSQ